MCVIVMDNDTHSHTQNENRNRNKNKKSTKRDPMYIVIPYNTADRLK